MKLKKFILAINIILSLFILFGCTDSLPVFKTTNFKNDKTVCVNIDGIEYKMYPVLKWEPLPGQYKTIGYAGSRKRPITCLESDTERNFIYIDSPKHFWEEARQRYLHRTDKEIPNPSEDSVDKIVFEEHDYRKGELKVTETIITEKEIIKELFDAFNGNKTARASGIADYSIALSCYADDIPGMVYWMNIEISEEKILLGNNSEGYVEISEALLEKLAGYEINVEELVAENQG